MEAIIDKLKKVRELADRGYQGEALAAARMLKVLLDKHGLTMADLQDEKTQEYRFKYMFGWEKAIIIQCASKVLDKPTMSYKAYKGRKGIYLDLTEWQYREVTDMTTFHLKQFRKELMRKTKQMEIAYLNKHNIFADSSEGGESLSQEELNELLRTMQDLDDVTFQKKLTS